MGGLSTEREVSLSTGNSVVEVMIRKGLKVFPIDVDRNIANNLKGIDLAFNALHGTYGEDGCIQGLLEYLKIADLSEQQNTKYLKSFHQE